MSAPTVDLWCAVSADGYLYGATRDDDGSRISFWAPYYDSDQNQDEWNVLQLKNVPEELAKRLEVQGTQEQDFGDGYLAWNAARSYWPNDEGT